MLIEITRGKEVREHNYCSIHGYYPSRTAVGCPQCELQQPTRAQMVAMRPAATPPPDIQERDRKARAWDALEKGGKK